MILRCPSCSAQYLVANTAIGPTGRKVRCSSCGHVWFQDPPTQRSAPQVMEPEPPQERPPRAARRDGGRPDGESRRPPNINLPATRQPRRSGKALAAGWLGLLLVVGGIAAGGYFARDKIVQFWPPAVQLYEMLGVDLTETAAEAFPPDLNLSNLEPEYTVEDGRIVLLLRGEISNAGTEPIDVPELEALLTGENGEPLESWLIALDETAIAPGGSIGFESRRVDPSAEAVHLEVRMASHAAETAEMGAEGAAPAGHDAHPVETGGHAVEAGGHAVDESGHPAEDGHAPDAPGLEFHGDDEHAPTHQPSH